MPSWYLWIQATQAVLWIALTIYTWQSNQRAADRNAVRAIEVAQGMLEHRVLQVEECVKHLPTNDDVGAIAKNVAILLERTKHQEGWIETVAQRLDRIDNWLRENK